jgi:hypothetical protein
MPTVFVAPKPVPVMATVAPGAWAVGVKVIDPAADAVEMRAKENNESIRKAVATVFLSSIFSTPYFSVSKILHRSRFKILHVR